MSVKTYLKVTLRIESYLCHSVYALALAGGAEILPNDPGRRKDPAGQSRKKRKAEDKFQW